jgi:hypothetical protein
MNVLRGRRHALLAACLTACAAGWAAPVVLTPGSVAVHSIYPAIPPANSGGGTTLPIETLSTCVVSPTAGDRTIVLSSRNWYGYTKPVKVYYKMVGGGAGVTLYAGGTAYPQMASAGGSSAILKNGVLVGSANGMNAGASARNVSAGTFTVSSTDTIRFITGGGGGSGVVGQNYVGYFDFYGYPGGGGGGYYGGGSGQTYSNPGGGAPTVGSPVATGGTGTAGGTGAGTSGGLNFGGTTAGNAGVGATSVNGASRSFGLWTGYLVVNYTAGGGGAPGNPGLAGGESPSCPAIPAGSGRVTTPIATTFDLNAMSGTQGFGQGYFDGASWWSCAAGGAMGEIVLQYQAPSCDLIPNWNQP